MRFSEKKRRKAGVNSVPLMDVVFLLVIFFAVTATFMDQPAIKLDLPEASAEPLKQQPKDIMTVYVSSEGQVFYGDRLIKLEDLPGLLKAGLAEGRPSRLTIKADREVIHGKVIEVMDLARQNGIEVVTVGTQKKAGGGQ